jgi:imidazolonepropionase-like amidohydrolase
MMRILGAFCIVLSLQMMLCAQTDIAPTSKSDSVAIIHAKAILIPGQAAVEDTTIVVVDGKIESTGHGIYVPMGIRKIDARGQLVTPGLMNSASQLGLLETGTEDTSDAAVKSGPFGPDFDVEYALNPNSTLLPVARADGLTRAMVMPTGSAGAPFNGLGAVLRLSEGESILDLPKAAVIAEMGGMAVPRSGGSRSAQWMLLRSALEAARKSDGPPGGSDVLRATALSPDNVAALKPVLDRRIPLVLIAYRESDLRQAAALVDDFTIKVVLVGADEAWRCASLLASRKIAVVLDPYASTPSTYDQMGARLDNAAILDRAGVVISFKAAFVHVSYNAGIAIREGAGIAVANGLSWSQAIKALTLNAAETWGIEDHYGTLEPGKDADLVLWNGDPLEPRSAPDMVFIQGKQVSLKTRQTELEGRYNPNRAANGLPAAYR